MMGERLVMQESLFYEFRLEDHVPPDHLLRRIDRFVDCSALPPYPGDRQVEAPGRHLLAGRLHL